MKATGIVRKVDELGRIVLPIEMRRTLGISVKDSVELYTEADSIILRKLEDACVFCHRTNDIVNFAGKNICTGCLADLKALR